MPNEQGPEVNFAGGKISSSKITPYHYIPTEAVRRYARRCELGVERKGEKAWNAMTSNQDALIDKALFLERLDHIIGHTLSLRDKVAKGLPLIGDDDDAGAIIWGGGYACCATAAMEDAKPVAKCSSCGGDGLAHYGLLLPGQEPGHVACPACKGTGTTSKR